MFYLLFRYLKDEQEKDYQEFKSKKELIKFIGERKDEIEINKIIEATGELKLNWIPQLDEIGKPKSQRRGRPRKEKEEAEPEQLNQEEPDEEEMIIERGKSAIEAAEKEQEDKIIKWELCSKCKKNKVVSSSKRKICGECLQKEKKRISDKRKKEILLSSETRT